MFSSQLSRTKTSFRPRTKHLNTKLQLSFTLRNAIHFWSYSSPDATKQMALSLYNSPAPLPSSHPLKNSLSQQKPAFNHRNNSIVAPTESAEFLIPSWKGRFSGRNSEAQAWLLCSSLFTSRHFFVETRRGDSFWERSTPSRPLFACCHVKKWTGRR